MLGGGVMEILFVIVKALFLATLFFLTAPWIVFSFMMGFYEIYERYLGWVADKMKI